MVACEQCQSNDIDLVEQLADGRVRVGCLSCGYAWVRGTARAAAATPVDSFAEARRRFPSAEDVDSALLARVDRLKNEFLALKPQPRPEVVAYWARYRQIFSHDGLRDCEPQDLKDFANTEIGARPGNMSVFNSAWNRLGPAEAADQTRDAIEYLLRGSDHVSLEDRLTTLIFGGQGKGMKGFKESLLTKVLCIVYPNRFLPILTYSSPNVGKREVADLIYGLDLPEAARVTWTIGRLIIWSNDVLLRLVGEGFVDTQHAAHFLWEVKDRKAELNGSI